MFSFHNPSPLSIHDGIASYPLNIPFTFILLVYYFSFFLHDIDLIVRNRISLENGRTPLLLKAVTQI